MVLLLVVADIMSTYYDMKKYGIKHERGIGASKSVKKYGVRKGLAVHWVVESFVWVGVLGVFWVFAFSLFQFLAFTVIMALVLAVVNNVVYYFLERKSVRVMIPVTGLLFIVGLWGLFFSGFDVVFGIELLQGVLVGCFVYWVVLSGVVPAVLMKLKVIRRF